MGCKIPARFNETSLLNCVSVSIMSWTLSTIERIMPTKLVSLAGFPWFLLKWVNDLLIFWNLLIFLEFAGFWCRYIDVCYCLWYFSRWLCMYIYQPFVLASFSSSSLHPHISVWNHFLGSLSLSLCLSISIPASFSFTLPFSPPPLLLPPSLPPPTSLSVLLYPALSLSHTHTCGWEVYLTVFFIWLINKFNTLTAMARFWSV